jgi:hypothetical protein
LNQRLLRELRHPNRSSKVDETHAKVGGILGVPYRAVILGRQRSTSFSARSGI